MSYEEERIHVSYEEEDTFVMAMRTFVERSCSTYANTKTKLTTRRAHETLSLLHVWRSMTSDLNP